MGLSSPGWWNVDETLAIKWLKSSMQILQNVEIIHGIAVEICRKVSIGLCTVPRKCATTSTFKQLFSPFRLFGLHFQAISVLFQTLCSPVSSNHRLLSDSLLSTFQWSSSSFRLFGIYFQVSIFLFQTHWSSILVFFPWVPWSVA